MKALRRAAPAFLLFFLSPLIAEFLLGDLTVKELPALFALAPLYGGGAILIREILRRSGRSWPSFLLLGFAYALIEEAVADQSLFNPNFLHLRLLDYGWIPALGTSLAWCIYVLGIHIAWSLAVPIGLAEAFFARRGNQPWLGRFGLGVAALLYLVGVALVARFSLGQTDFRASPLQLGISVLIALAAIVAAFLAFPRRSAEADPGKLRRSASVPVLGGFSLIAGSAFLLVYSLGPNALHWPWPLTVAGELLVAGAIIAFFAWANRGRLWTARETWAAAFGGMLCYTWVGYRIDHDLHPAAGPAQHSIFVLLALAVAAWSGMRALKSQ